MALDKRDIITSPRMVELSRKRRKRRRVFFVISFFVFIGLLVGLSYLSKYQKINIKEIRVEGTHIIDADKVIEETQKEISGNYIYLFSKSNTFIYPRRSLESKLRKEFPRIEELSINLDGLQVLYIKVKERFGAYLWCGASLPASNADTGENCYFVNSDGLIFDKAPYFSGNVYFKFYTPILDPNVPLGQNLFDKEKFRTLVNTIDRLEYMGLHTTVLVMLDDNKYYFKITDRKSTNMPEIWWNKENELSKVVDNLELALKNKDFQKEIFSRLNTLSYIDLRFDNKVLYKFQ